MDVDALYVRHLKSSSTLSSIVKGRFLPRFDDRIVIYVYESFIELYQVRHMNNNVETDMKREQEQQEEEEEEEEEYPTNLIGSFHLGVHAHAATALPWTTTPRPGGNKGMENTTSHSMMFDVLFLVVDQTMWCVLSFEVQSPSSASALESQQQKQQHQQHDASWTSTSDTPRLSFSILSRGKLFPHLPINNIRRPPLRVYSPRSGGPVCTVLPNPDHRRHASDHPGSSAVLVSCWEGVLHRIIWYPSDRPSLDGSFSVSRCILPADARRILSFAFYGYQTPLTRDYADRNLLPLIAQTEPRRPLNFGLYSLDWEAQRVSDGPWGIKNLSSTLQGADAVRITRCGEDDRTETDDGYMVANLDRILYVTDQGKQCETSIAIHGDQDEPITPLNDDVCCHAVLLTEHTSADLIFCLVGYHTGTLIGVRLHLPERDQDAASTSDMEVLHLSSAQDGDVIPAVHHIRCLETSADKESSLVVVADREGCSRLLRVIHKADAFFIVDESAASSPLSSPISTHQGTPLLKAVHTPCTAGSAPYQRSGAEETALAACTPHGVVLCRSGYLCRPLSNAPIIGTPTLHVFTFTDPNTADGIRRHQYLAFSYDSTPQTSAQTIFMSLSSFEPVDLSPSPIQPETGNNTTEAMTLRTDVRTLVLRSVSLRNTHETDHQQRDADNADHDDLLVQVTPQEVRLVRSYNPEEHHPPHHGIDYSADSNTTRWLSSDPEGTTEINYAAASDHMVLAATGSVLHWLQIRSHRRHLSSGYHIEVRDCIRLPQQICCLSEPVHVTGSIYCCAVGLWVDNIVHLVALDDERGCVSSWATLRCGSVPPYSLSLPTFLSHPDTLRVMIGLSNGTLLQRVISNVSDTNIYQHSISLNVDSEHVLSHSPLSLCPCQDENQVYVHSGHQDALVLRDRDGVVSVRRVLREFDGPTLSAIYLHTPSLGSSVVLVANPAVGPRSGSNRLIFAEISTQPTVRHYSIPVPVPSHPHYPFTEICDLSPLSAFVVGGGNTFHIVDTESYQVVFRHTILDGYDIHSLVCLPSPPLSEVKATYMKTDNSVIKTIAALLCDRGGTCSALSLFDVTIRRVTTGREYDVRQLCTSVLGTRTAIDLSPLSHALLAVAYDETVQLIWIDRNWSQGTAQISDASRSLPYQCPQLQSASSAVTTFPEPPIIAGGNIIGGVHVWQWESAFKQLRLISYDTDIVHSALAMLPRCLYTNATEDNHQKHNTQDIDRVLLLVADHSFNIQLLQLKPSLSRNQYSDESRSRFTPYFESYNIRQGSEFTDSLDNPITDIDAYFLRSQAYEDQYQDINIISNTVFDDEQLKKWKWDHLSQDHEPQTPYSLSTYGQCNIKDLVNQLIPGRIGIHKIQDSYQKHSSHVSHRNSTFLFITSGSGIGAIIPISKEEYSQLKMLEGLIGEWIENFPSKFNIIYPFPHRSTFSSKAPFGLPVDKEHVQELYSQDKGTQTHDQIEEYAQDGGPQCIDGDIIYRYLVDLSQEEQVKLIQSKMTITHEALINLICSLERSVW